LINFTLFYILSTNTPLSALDTKQKYKVNVVKRVTMGEEFQGVVVPGYNNFTK
jgi:hypothetical protein